LLIAERAAEVLARYQVKYQKVLSKINLDN